MSINGKTLIKWGLEPGPAFKDIIARAQEMESDGKDESEIYDYVMGVKEAKDAEEAERIAAQLSLRTNSIPFEVFLEPEDEDEQNNLNAVIAHMDNIVRLPSVVSAAVMPDSMPSGSAPGTIPVGGVVVTDGTIHPGMHSSDICCSLAITVLKRDEDVSRVLDEAQKVTHFGFGKRSKSEVRRDPTLKSVLERFEGNKFLDNPKMYDVAEGHFMTQGDGNHFLYVGHLGTTGDLAIVTHHGSRGLGALLYKFGMAAAKKHTAIVAPRIPDHQAWLDFDTEHGQEYWNALQIVREWTKANHFAIHDALAKRLGNKVIDRFWNEHNFVFMKDDLFYHAKGATPSYDGFSPDDDGRTLIPLNMSQPILLTEHSNNEKALYFAPHGAGRNFSRTEHARRIAAEYGDKDHRDLSEDTRSKVVAKETAGLDVRFFSGKADISELPSSYKDANQVSNQISKHNLAKVVDTIEPGGTIMAGVQDEPWKKKR